MARRFQTEPPNLKCLKNKFDSIVLALYSYYIICTLVPDAIDHRMYNSIVAYFWTANAHVLI